MIRPSIGVLLSCAIACCPPLAPAAEYFVSPSGSATNQGTANSPWPSISFALSNAAGGDVVTALPGIYPEAVVIERSGYAGHPTTLRSAQKWKAIIQHSPSHGIYVADGITNVLIDGLQVGWSAIDGVKVGSWATVRNCWIHHSSGQGIAAHRTHGVLLERNLIEFNGTHPVFDHGIYMSGTRHVVRACVIRWNRCFGCQFYSEAPASSSECSFYNNLVYSNRNALTVWAPGGETNFVFNNTLVSSRYVIRASGGVLCVSNNILIGPSARRIFSADQAADFRADCNVISAAGRRRGLRDLLAASPAFVDPQNGLFWLAADSPARGVAAAEAAPSVDFFGNKQDQVSDAGAFQYHPALAADSRVLDPPPPEPDYWQTNILVNP